ncbi:MAG: ribosomal protein S18-alanine N-acetyltransferase [bacterium]|nr:ribosomal protein S18-alanine N-acetyltransferase [bacterium]
MSDIGHNFHSIIIRDAVVQDIETILAIERDSYVDPWGEESFRYLMFQKNGIAIVAAQQFPIGYAFGRVTLDEGELLNLAVSKPYRKRNLGRAILNEFLNRCWKLGANKVYLEVRVKNTAAIQLYRSAGFIIEGRRNKYYQDGEDAFIMKLIKQ